MGMAKPVLHQQRRRFELSAERQVAGVMKKCIVS